MENNMSQNLHILVLKGGNSSERLISLKTASHVESSLERMNYKFTSLDLTSPHTLCKHNLSNINYVFIALHGGFGEDGTIQALLKILDIPHNGTSFEYSSICMNKILTKHIAQSLNIKTPKGFIANKDSLSNFEKIRTNIGLPFITKPSNEGCSIGVSLIENEFELAKALENMSNTESTILLEEYINGSEITVGVLDNEILPFLSITHAQKLFNYDAKFNSPSTTIYKEINFTAEINKKIKRATKLLCKTLNLRDYARFDYIIKDGEPFLLEINTLPGLNSHSVFVKACNLAEITYDQMIIKIINNKMNN